MLAARAKVGNSGGQTSTNDGRDAEAAADAARRKAFRNRNAAVLLQRFFNKGDAVSLGIGPTATSVLMALGQYANSTEWRIEGEGDAARIVSGYVWPTQSTLASKLAGRRRVLPLDAAPAGGAPDSPKPRAASVRTVQRALGQLVAAGVVRIETEVVRDAETVSAGTAPYARQTRFRRLSRYRIVLPLDAAADGAEGIETTSTETSGLRYVRHVEPPVEPPKDNVGPDLDAAGGDGDVAPEATTTSPSRRQRRRLVGDNDVAYTATRTSQQCSGVSVPSESSSAEQLHRPLSREEDSGFRIPDDRTDRRPDGPTETAVSDGRRVRLLARPDGERNGWGRLVETGEEVAIPMAVWNLLESGDGSTVVLGERTRPKDGSRYWWASERGTTTTTKTKTKTKTSRSSGRERTSPEVEEESPPDWWPSPAEIAASEAREIAASEARRSSGSSGFGREETEDAPREVRFVQLEPRLCGTRLSPSQYVVSRRTGTEQMPRIVGKAFDGRPIEINGEAAHKFLKVESETGRLPDISVEAMNGTWYGRHASASLEAVEEIPF